jgi:ribosomal RNA-processing protein 12
MSIGTNNKQNDFDETKSMISDSDAASAADSFRSWATNWSDCTNATFNKVHKYWRSNSAFHKEILAVLAAITEVIKENNGKESETEYMAALMTGMESVESNQESCAAFLYLIALAIKKVPENVLRAKHTDLIRSLTDQLDKYGNAPNNVTLIKSCLKCLCWILKSLGKQEWSNKSTIKCYIRILEYVQDERPKIRKCGQEAVRLILNSCASSIDEDAKSNYETISSLTADYCLDLIMNDNREDDKEDDSEIKKESVKSKNQRILHILTLFKYTIHHYTVKKLKSIGECLLRLMTLKDVVI